jgi:hypothetical protein
MIDYYRANYPRPPYDDIALPNVQSPVLVIHGTGDPFLLTVGHNSTWDFVDGPLTIRTIPGAGHFVQSATGRGHQDPEAVPTRRAADAPISDGALSRRSCSADTR